MAQLSTSLARKARALSLAAIYAVSPLAAMAKDEIAPACRAAGAELAQLKCSTAVSKKSIAKNEARIKAADSELTCMNLITKDIEQNGSKTANLTEFPKRGDACRVARDLKLTVGGG